MTGAYGVFGFLGGDGVDSSLGEETSYRPTLRFAIAGRLEANLSAQLRL